MFCVPRLGLGKFAVVVKLRILKEGSLSWSIRISPEEKGAVIQVNKIYSLSHLKSGVLAICSLRPTFPFFSPYNLAFLRYLSIFYLGQKFSHVPKMCVYMCEYTYVCVHVCMFVSDRVYLLL